MGDRLCAREVWVVAIVRRKLCADRREGGGRGRRKSMAGEMGR